MVFAILVIAIIVPEDLELMRDQVGEKPLTKFHLGLPSKSLGLDGGGAGHTGMGRFPVQPLRLTLSTFYT